MVRLVAIQKLRYGAKEYQVGETFEASERDANVLKAIRKAADPPPDVPRKPAPLPRQTNFPPVTAAPSASAELRAEAKVESSVEPVTAVEPVLQSTATTSVPPRRVAEAPKKEPEPQVQVPTPAPAPVSTSGRIRRADLRPEE